MSAQGVCVAFTADWNVTNPTWTRLDNPLVPALGYRVISSPHSANVVNGWSIDRGRSYELDKTQTGTASITCTDIHGIFDITNPDSPYLGGLGPMLRAKINFQNPSSGAYSDLFTGFVESWNYVLDQSEQFMNVTINLVDGFEPLTRAEVDVNASGVAPFYAQPVQDRIEKALQDAGWPDDPEWRRINTGNVYVPHINYDPGTTCMQVIQDAADGEFPNVANIFIGKEGQMCFNGRLAYFDPFNPSLGFKNPPQLWNVGDAFYVEEFGYAPIANIEWNLDQTNLINSALVYPQGATQAQITGQNVFDATSIALYGERSLQIPDLAVLAGESDGNNALQECLVYGNYFINSYKDPQQRISQLEFHSRPAGTSALWKFMCEVEIGDVVAVFTNNPGGGGFNPDVPPNPPYNGEFFVQGIHYTVQPNTQQIPDMTMTLDVTPRQYYYPNPFS